MISAFRRIHPTTLLFALFVLALLPRLYVAFAWAGEPVWDGHYYDFGARRIAAGFGYSDDLVLGDRTIWHPWCHYPVGYSAYVALFYRGLGASRGVLAAVNALTSALIPLVTMGLAGHAMSRTRAFVAGALDAVGECRHPTVALIKGPCVGGGLEIACQCDLRISGSSGRFGVPINRLGFAIAYGELAGLLALAGRAVAAEMLLEGRVWDAEEAMAKGLLSRVVSDDQAEQEAYATARRIADGAPLVARWHKQYIRRLMPHVAPLTEMEIDANFDYFNTADYRIGYDAFINKKKPKFVGR